MPRSSAFTAPLLASLLAATAIGSAACSDATAPETGTVRLAFATQPSATALRASMGGFPAGADVVVAAGTDTLVITRVQLVLGEIELKSSDDAAAACADDDGRDDCEELSLGPVLMDLPLTAGATDSPIAVAIPAGSYDEMEFELDAVSASDPRAAAFLAANPGLAGVSVRVEGRYRGEPFTYTSRVDAELELEFATPMVVGASGDANVTVRVDVASWFRDATSDALLDPRSDTNAATIGANIARSFDAFEDEDHDGDDDGPGHDR